MDISERMQWHHRGYKAAEAEGWHWFDELKAQDAFDEFREDQDGMAEFEFYTEATWQQAAKEWTLGWSAALSDMEDYHAPEL